MGWGSHSTPARTPFQPQTQQTELHTTTTNITEERRDKPGTLKPCQLWLRAVLNCPQLLALQMGVWLRQCSAWTTNAHQLCKDSRLHLQRVSASG